MTITALVVDDDDGVRMVTVEALTDAGIDVIEAVRAETALAILNIQATGIDVLVTDVSSLASWTGAGPSVTP